MKIENEKGMSDRARRYGTTLAFCPVIFLFFFLNNLLNIKKEKPFINLFVLQRFKIGCSDEDHYIKMKELLFPSVPWPLARIY